MVTFFLDIHYHKVMHAEWRRYIISDPHHWALQTFLHHRWWDQTMWHHWIDRSWLTSKPQFPSSVSTHEVTVMYPYACHHEVTEWLGSIPGCSQIASVIPFLHRVSLASHNNHSSLAGHVTERFRFSSIDGPKPDQFRSSLRKQHAYLPTQPMSYQQLAQKSNNWTVRALWQGYHCIGWYLQWIGPRDSYVWTLWNKKSDVGALASMLLHATIFARDRWAHNLCVFASDDLSSVCHTLPDHETLYASMGRISHSWWASLMK